MNRLIAPAPPWATSSAILLVRLVVGAAFVLHSLPKFQNPFGWMTAMGAENAPPGFIQALAPVCEMAGGILLAIGLFTRVACLMLVSVMIGALALVHIPHGDPFVGKPGQPSAELAVVYLSFSLLVAAIGAGAYSLDAVLFAERRALRAAPGLA